MDCYGDFIVCQFLSAGAEYWKDAIIAHLMELVPSQGIYERSDAKIRKRENLPFRQGSVWGKAPPDLITIQEGNLQYYVDVIRGHKTGFYLDQRENRFQIADYAQGGAVLNCFAYSGGFGLAALRYGADKVINIDASAGALELLNRNRELNQLSDQKIENMNKYNYFLDFRIIVFFYSNNIPTCISQKNYKYIYLQI